MEYDTATIMPPSVVEQQRSAEKEDHQHYTLHEEPIPKPVEPVVPAEPEESKNLGFDKWTFNPSPNEQSEPVEAPTVPVEEPTEPTSEPSEPVEETKTTSPNKDLDVSFNEYQDIEEEDT